MVSKKEVAAAFNAAAEALGVDGNERGDLLFVLSKLSEEQLDFFPIGADNTAIVAFARSAKGRRVRPWCRFKTAALPISLRRPHSFLKHSWAPCIGARNPACVSAPCPQQPRKTHFLWPSTATMSCSLGDWPGRGERVRSW